MIELKTIDAGKELYRTPFVGVLEDSETGNSILIGGWSLESCQMLSDIVAEYCGEYQMDIGQLDDDVLNEQEQHCLVNENGAILAVAVTESLDVVKEIVDALK